MNCIKLVTIFFMFKLVTSQSCTSKELFVKKDTCDLDEFVGDPVYIFYSVNPVEGFNLRRDVFLRLAVFIKKLRSQRGYKNAHLVLPPFNHLYHWRSPFSQTNLFWNHFFDIDSIKLYCPSIIDMWEFFDIFSQTTGRNYIDLDVYKLQHFESMFEDGVFIDKFEEAACTRNEYDNHHYLDYFNITEKTITCLNFQGGASLLVDVLKEYEKKHHKPGRARIALIAHAEVALHDSFGSAEYWRARRSMRFNRNLRAIADTYRYDYLGSSVEIDQIRRPSKWTDEKPYRGAQGGNYLCVHLRRADFIYGRESQLPTLRSVANQIKRKLAELEIDLIYLSSDCSRSEFYDLKNLLRGVRLYKFKPPWEVLQQLGDGGLAVIDQIICSHAKWFIGTLESTFTFRIYEEREILGFPIETTFNTLCKRDDLIDCNKNSVWTIQF